MYSLNAFLRLSDGDTQDFNVKLEDKEILDVHAVYIDGFSREMLCSDFGAEIDIKADGISRWMANFRQCTYWSAPAFGSSFRGVPDETQCIIYEKTDKT